MSINPSRSDDSDDSDKLDGAIIMTAYRPVVRCLVMEIGHGLGSHQWCPGAWFLGLLDGALPMIIATTRQPIMTGECNERQSRTTLSARYHWCTGTYRTQAVQRLCVFPRL